MGKRTKRTGKRDAADTNAAGCLIAVMVIVVLVLAIGGMGAIAAGLG